jgi:hypothetical protein
MHECVLSGLEAGVTYYYRVGDPSSPDSLSAVFSFRAGPVATWAVYGDLGTQFMYKSLQTLLRDSAAGAFSGVVHVGDVAYDLHSEHGRVGDDFMRGMQPVTAANPYLLVPGNHEAHHDFKHYRNRFAGLNRLAAASGSDDLFWYSVDQPQVHMVFFNTEVFEAAKASGDNATVVRQFQWLDADLREANKHRAERPWIVTFGHKCDWHDHVKFKALRELFHDQGVDLHVCGHEHNYQRLYPGIKDRVDRPGRPDAFVDPPHWMQMVVGSPGCHDHVSAHTTPYPDALAHAEFNYGYGLLTVANQTHLHWQWKLTAPGTPERTEDAFSELVVGLQKDKEPGIIADDFWLVQHNHGPRRWL